jgi:hypothetical protein
MMIFLVHAGGHQLTLNRSGIACGNTAKKHKQAQVPALLEDFSIIPNLELITGFEPETSSLPRKCSTD